MIQFEINHVGSDDLIVITGGEKPHLGTVVVGTWLGDHTKVVSHGLSHHHKEEELFIELAKVWSNTYQKTVVISGGIHFDKETKKDFDIMANKIWEKFFHLMADHKMQTTVVPS